MRPVLPPSPGQKSYGRGNSQASGPERDKKALARAQLQPEAGGCVRSTEAGRGVGLARLSREGVNANPSLPLTSLGERGRGWR